MTIGLPSFLFDTLGANIHNGSIQTNVEEIIMTAPAIGTLGMLIFILVDTAFIMAQYLNWYYCNNIQ